MLLTRFLQSLRPPGGCSAWVQQLSEKRPISRQALEHYLAGRRIPKPDIFRDILVVAGRSPDDQDGWRAWSLAKGIPFPTAGV